MQVTRDSKLQLPETLREKLLAFRALVWRLKLFEAAASALIGIFVGFLATYVLDRFFDTPQWLRTLIFASAVMACGLIPVAFNRWVLRRRRLDQLANLLSQTRPDTGDQLLGVIELSEDRSEQSRSPELVQAAIAQVAEAVTSQDLSSAIPTPKHKQRGMMAAALAIVAAILLVVTAAAARNAWSRFLAPWKPTPRYTFAAVKPLPAELVVPHGEPFEFSIGLQPATRWEPATAKASLSGSPARQTTLQEDRYRFDLPGQIAPGHLDVRVGDFRGSVPIQPMLRPELHSVQATITLPAYLGRRDVVEREIRGGSMSVVKGSATQLTATASRELTRAVVNGRARNASGTQFSTQAIAVDEREVIELDWEDQFGLTPQKPFALTIEAVEDESPSVVCENLPRRKVLLDSEVLAFAVRAHDDFGVRTVGIQWQGMDKSVRELASGEKVIGAGDFQAEFLELAATFCAADEGITPQPISFRVYVEDYLPGRERVYSSTCVFDVLDAQQHAIWITSQLSRWHRMSLDVRDREMQLLEANKQLRDLGPDQLDSQETRDQLRQQAERERANGQRLRGLVRTGEGLLKEAMRNSEIGVGHLDQWAEMMKVLKEISENRMPSVADLLKKAAESSRPSNNSQNKRQIGQNRLTQPAGGDADSEPESDETPPSDTPRISDIESSHHQFKPEASEEPSSSKPSQPRLTLPSTQLAGNASSDSGPPPENELDEAVRQQEELLAEFDKVAADLSEILANLEGSTLVKRLKASSRKQQQVAARLATLASDSFGVSDREKEANAQAFADLAKVEATSSREASHIMDDMSAYFQRSRYMLFRRVLDDMRAQDVTAGLRLLGDELRRENGLSISQAEYWSDTFDRWAEDLVEVTQNGACPGSKSKGSLPPSIVLEVLKLLEGEVKLREQTRVAEQARPAVTDTQHAMEAEQLSLTQNEFQHRMTKVVHRILELPDASSDFAAELNVLTKVTGVMAETTEILARPDTGPNAIAAETEIIELLLQSKRFNPNAGGGGGSNPGGGGQGDTETPALALVGAGVNAKEFREEMSAAPVTGTTGPGLPEEFRSGLDEYFNRLENWKTN